MTIKFLLDDIPNTILSIDQVWMFVSEDETGEGVIAGSLPGFVGLMPLIAADEERLKSLRPIAQKIANASKKKIKLVKFSLREEIEYINPTT